MFGDDTGLQVDAEGVVVAGRIKDCVVVTAPGDLGSGRMAELERVTLKHITADHTRGVIFELGGVQFMDSSEFGRLKVVAQMAQHLGVKPMLVGLRPGIIAHLAQTDADITGIPAAMGLNDALAILGR